MACSRLVRLILSEAQGFGTLGHLLRRKNASLNDRQDFPLLAHC